MQRANGSGAEMLPLRAVVVGIVGHVEWGIQPAAGVFTRQSAMFLIAK